MTVLGIETSCDECAAAVVADGVQIRSNVVYSQIEEHRRYQGVVPEIASRKHVEWIDGVVAHALRDAAAALDEIDAVAVTTRPGLIGSLLVGLSYAKGLALARELPLIAVDHVQAHLYAPHMERDLAYPYVGLLLSGGHTLIAEVHGFDRIKVLGATIDERLRRGVRQGGQVLRHRLSRRGGDPALGGVGQRRGVPLSAPRATQGRPPL